MTASISLSDLAASPWFITPQAGMALALQLTQGPLAITLPEKPPVVYQYNYAYFPTAQQAGSIAVVTVNGALYDYYAQYLCAQLDLIYADPNMAGLIVKMNSPGGQISASWRFADKLMAVPWPTACVVDYGTAASAGYLIGCSCDLFVAGHAADSVGSIGVYIPWQDLSGMFTKMGIVQEDIYADQSTLKNSEARAAKAGDMKPIKALATASAARFIAYVEERRPTLSDKNALKGAMFDAQAAVNCGLLDGIASLDEIIAALRGTSTTLTLTSPPRTDMFGYAKVAALQALASLAAAPTDEQLKAANAELAALGITNAVIISQAEFEALAGAADPAVLTAAQADVTRLTGELTTAKTDRDAKATALATAEAEVERLGKQAGATPSEAKGKTDATPDADEAAPKLNYTAESANYL